jgi:hypothetical protein
MKHFLTTLSLLTTLHAGAVGHGPIVHWNQDPAKSCQIVWLERSGVKGIEGKWSVGPAGFGYGDDDDSTVFARMKGRFGSIAIRRRIQLPPGVPPDADLVLRVNYDDGFIAWLGGEEIARKNIAPDGSRAAGTHEAGQWEDIRLGRIGRFLSGEGAVIALQGFNNDLSSSDFTLHPIVVAKRGGEEWPVSPANEAWEYLANAKPEDGWQTRLAGLKPNASTAGFGLEWRVKSTGEWQSCVVSSNPFAGSAHRVFRAAPASLPAGKDIEFRITRKDTAESETFAFRMPPEKAASVRFVTGGDLYHEREPMDRMNRTAAAQDPLFALLGGDLAYANNVSYERWFGFIDSWERNARTPDGRLVPMIVAAKQRISGIGWN